MKNRPRLSARSRMQTPHGIVLGLPTKCELGTLEANCHAPAVLQVGNIRMCQRHADLLQAIQDAAPALENFAPRKIA